MIHCVHWWKRFAWALGLYSIDLRKRVVSEYDANRNCHRVARMFSVSVLVVAGWTLQYKLTGLVHRSKMSGIRGSVSNGCSELNRD